MHWRRRSSLFATKAPDLFGPLSAKYNAISQDFKKIVAWQRAHKLTLAVYRQTAAFPATERYGLTSQLRRAAYSVPANISEGSGRDGGKDFLRFLTIALASLKETDYFLMLALDLGYLTEQEHAFLSEAAERTFGALQGLINAVRKGIKR